MFRRNGESFEKQVRAGEVYVGDLAADGDIRIDGTVRGRIITSSRLVVGPEGRVDGSIRAGEVVVAGEIRGTVEAAIRLHVLEGARLFADTFAGLLLIEEGAECRGSVRLRSLRPDGKVEEVVVTLPPPQGAGVTRQSSERPRPATAQPE